MNHLKQALLFYYEELSKTEYDNSIDFQLINKIIESITLTVYILSEYLAYNKKKVLLKF